MGYTQAEFINMFAALFVILVLGIILRLTLKDKTLAVRQIPLHIIGATLVGIEVVKQVYRLCVGDWNTWCLPFHFCSFFLIWYAIALCTRGNTRQLMYFCSLTGGVIVTVVMYFAPHIVLQDGARIFWDSFNNAHTYFFHMGVVAYWIWMLMLNIYQPQRQHIKKTVLLYGAFFLVTIAAAFTFHENYTDVLSPSLALFENFRLFAGQFVYDLCLLLVGLGVITGISYALYFLTSKLSLTLNRQPQKAIANDDAHAN